MMYVQKFPGRFGRAELLPCKHRGEPTGETRPCTVCTGTQQVPLHFCHGGHGVCAVDLLPAGVQCCRVCPDREYEAKYKFHWISTARLIQDAVRLAGLIPADCTGIVGIPRSGMIPAAVIATQLHLPLYHLEGNNLHRCYVGESRGAVVTGAGGPLAVVDDTVYAGSAMRNTRAIIGVRLATYHAVYVNSLRPESKTVVDSYAAELPAPHLLEWNWANNGPAIGNWVDVPAWGRGIATDLDGVIVHDHASGGRLDTPYMVPRANPIPLICTGRSELARGATEAELRGIGAKWDRLEMLPSGTPQTVAAMAAHKAKHFAASGCGLYVESDPAQAELIHKATGLPVACPIISTVFQ